MRKFRENSQTLCGFVRNSGCVSTEPTVTPIPLLL
jgi:hypothetical protein